MLRRILVVGVVACAFVHAAPPARAENAPARAPDWGSAETAAAFQDALDEWRADHDVYGAALRVFAPGRTDWTGTSGASQVFPFFMRETPFEGDNSIRVGSTTKMFTAVTTLQLVAEGRLALDDTLDAFLPGYPNADRITIEHLLRHRSGIPDVQLVDLLFMLRVIAQPGQAFDPVEFMHTWTYGPIPIISLFEGLAPVDRGPIAEPGEEFHYSQPGYFALGIAIESVTGKSLAANFAERIVEPLGLEHTKLLGPRDPSPIGYTNVFQILPLKLPSGWLLSSASAFNTSSWAAGGLVSTAHDLVEFLHAVVTGDLVTPELFVAMTDTLPVGDAFGEDTGSEYGLGVFRHPRDDYTTLGHGGAVPSGNATMTYVPELDLYVGAVANTDVTRDEEDPESQRDLVARVVDALKV